jgi:hypothetical protein
VLFVVFLGALLFLVRGRHDEKEALQFRDFKQPYASSRCLLHGCNPYSERDTRAEFLKAGGVDNDFQVFRPFSALYPPFSFAVLAPIAALDWHSAHQAWFWIVGILFAVAVMLAADLCVGPSVDPDVGPGGNLPSTTWANALLLAIFTVTSTILLMLGQISGPVIALLVIGFWCLLREKGVWVAVVAFTLALALKPHDSALLICYLPFAGRVWRKTFMATAVLTAIVIVAGTLWCTHEPASAHWLADLETNLHGNASAGGVNDPTRGSLEALNMANLQPVFAAEDSDEHVYNAAAQLVTLVLLGAWAVPAYRMRNGSAKHLLAIASMACIMLLPIYHRQYDTRVLLLVFPAVGLLLAWRARTWGVASLGLLALATLVTSHMYLNRLTMRQGAQIKAAGAVKTLLLYRPLPLVELALAVLLIAAFYSYARAAAQRLTA